MPIDAEQIRLDTVADALTLKVNRQVLAHPERRAQILARHLWNGRAGGLAGWAIRTAAANVDSDSGTHTARTRLLDRIFRRPGPQAPTVAQHDARAFQRRLDDLRGRGIELVQDDKGRWLRREGRGRQRLVPVETPHQLVQLRVSRAETKARKATIDYARRIGVHAPPKPGRRAALWSWSDFDPRLEQFWRRRVAMETARIAHDVLIDTWRDAAWDRMEASGALWVRKAQPNACGACLALADGIPRHASDRVFYRHTRCRCIPVVYRPGHVPPTGRELFDLLSEAQQDDLFRHRGGRVKAQALRDGSIDLTDLILINQDRAAVTDYVLGETATKDLPLGPPGAG